MPFPCSVKETPACPTADISLTLSSAGDVRGILLKEQWDIPLLQLLKWPGQAIDDSCAGSSVLHQYNVVPFSCLSLVHVLRLAHAFHPAWKCYCNRLNFTTLQIHLAFTQDYKALFKAQPLWESNISAVTRNKMTSSCSGKGCNKACWWVVSGIWPS